MSHQVHFHTAVAAPKRPDGPPGLVSVRDELAVIRALKTTLDRADWYSEGQGDDKAGGLSLRCGGAGRAGAREGRRPVQRRGRLPRKRRERIKLIFWDSTGVCLYTKLLEDGDFR